MNNEVGLTAGQTVDEALLLDVRAVARLFSLSTQTVRRLDSQGRIPRPIRIGRAVRWYKPHVLGWLAEKTFNATPPARSPAD
jgi:predicted DNA-binding transcriptional regulator AlpA